MHCHSNGIGCWGWWNVPFLYSIQKTQVETLKRILAHSSSDVMFRCTVKSTPLSYYPKMPKSPSQPQTAWEFQPPFYNCGFMLPPHAHKLWQKDPIRAALGTQCVRVRVWVSVQMCVCVGVAVISKFLILLQIKASCYEEPLRWSWNPKIIALKIRLLNKTPK